MGSKLVASILVSLMLASVLPIMLTSTLSAPPASAPTPPTIAFSPGLENILTGAATVYSTNTWDPAPWTDYPAGSNPPTIVANELGSGRIVAAGISWSLRDGYIDDTTIKPMMVAIFQWLSNDKEKASTKILWYEGYGVFYQNNKGGSTKLVTYLISQGYEDGNIVADGTEPISSIDLSTYDILFLPQLELGADGTGGDPDLLPEDDLLAIRNFVEVSGKGLLVVEACDYGTSNSHSYYKVQNRILENLDFGMYFQPDQLKKSASNGFEVPFDVNTGHWIGSAYGSSTCIVTSACSMTTEPEVSYGVMTWASPSFVYGQAEDVLAYEITVVNVGTLVDDYTLSGSDNAEWGIDGIVPNELTGVEPNESVTATLTLTIPSGAEPGDMTKITITASGNESSSVKVSAHVAESPVTPVQGEWTFVQASPRVLSYSMCVEGADEFIYILNSSQSGADEYGEGYYFMRYNTSTGYWEDLQLPPTGFKSNAHQMCWDGSNYLYAVSGGSYGDAEAQTRYGFWRYNITDNSWETLPDTPFWQGPGNALTWVELGTDEYIYAVLGTSSSSVGFPSGSYTPTNVQFWRFDIAENTWDQRLADILYGADDGTNLIWTHGDHIYALPGAYTESLPKEDERYFVRYSISENTWAEMEKVPYNADGGVDDGGSSVYLGGDYIYALKGGDDDGGGGSVPGDDFWRYSISNDNWDILPDIPAGIGEMAGCRMGYADGNLYYWVGPNNAHTVPERNLYVYGLPIVVPPLAVEVSISPTDNTGAPGTTFEYTVTVTNEGENDDTYTLTVAETRDWGPTLSENSMTIAVGASDTATLAVTIPDNAENGHVDNITVTATSQENAEIKDNATCTATVVIVPGYSVDVSISPSSKSGTFGDNLNYTVTVQNTGNTDDNYDLTVADNASPSWAPSLDNTTLGVAAGENKTTTLRVTIPDNAATGDVDEITVTATSATESTVSDSTTCTATVALAYGVEVSISPSARTRLPGDELTYTVTVGNTGGVEDTFSLAVTDNASWTPSIDPWSLTIAAGASGTATLTVTIPDDADDGDVDSITVTATSATDSTVSDSATCTATVVFEYEVLIWFIPAGENRVANFENENILVLEVKIIVENSEDDTDGTVTVTVLENIEGPVPPGMVHRYLNIETSIAQANIKGLLAKFRVSKSWVAQNGIDEGTIRMFENTENSWLELPTERIVDLDDDEFLYFEAEGQGLSLFAITGGTRGEAGGVPILLIALAVTAASAGGAAAAILWYKPKLPPTPKLPSLRRVRTRLPRIRPRRQIQLRLPEGIVEDIDKWVKERRFRSRADAIRTILATYDERERTRDFYKMLAKRSGEAKKKSKSLATYQERERTRDFYNMLTKRSGEAKKKSKSLATYQERERTRDFYKMLTKRSGEAKKKSKSLAPLEED